MSAENPAFFSCLGGTPAGLGVADITCGPDRSKLPDLPIRLRVAAVIEPKSHEAVSF